MRGRPRKFNKKNKDVQELTVVEQKRRLLAGDAWNTKEAGNVIGLWFLNGYLTEEEKEQAYYFSYLKETYEHVICAPQMAMCHLRDRSSKHVFTEKEKERYAHFIEKQYQRYIVCLRQCGGRSLLYLLRALSNEAMTNHDMAYVKQALSSLVMRFESPLHYNHKYKKRCSC